MRGLPSASRAFRYFFVTTLLICAPQVNAQITTNTALPISAGGGMLRIQTKIIRSSGNQADADRQLTVVAVPFVVVYGVTRKLAAFGIVPLLDKRMESTSEGALGKRNVSGLADVRFFLRYTFVQKDSRGATLRIAPFAGTMIPTGSRDVADDMGTLPRPLQLGTGSWSPFAGVVLTRQTFAWQIDASFSYQYNPEAGGFRFGDEARLDLASKIRLLPRQLGGGLPNFFYANLESNLIWRGENEMNGVENLDSGGVIWYLDPGIQYVTRRMVFESAIQIPVIQDLNGSALKNDFIFVISVRIAY